jgi:hypothetical protein
VRIILPIAAKPGHACCSCAQPISVHTRPGPGLDAATIGINRNLRGLARPIGVFQKQPDVIMQVLRLLDDR